MAVYQGEIREKPVDEAECTAFLQSYASAPVETYTGIVVADTATGQRWDGCDHAVQHFDPIPGMHVRCSDGRGIGGDGVVMGW